MTTLLIERYQSSPSWLKGLVILGVGYLSNILWTRITRSRRELRAASWILNQRRKAGIPDSDKRPFKIAKAEVEANRRKIHHSNPPATTAASPPPPPPPLVPLAPSPRPKSNLVRPPSPAPFKSADKISRASNLKDQPSTKNDPLTNNTKDCNNLNTSSSLKPTSDQPLVGRSLQKRVAPLSTDGSDLDQSEVEEENTTTRNRKKAKKHKNLSPSQIDSEPTLPGNLADNPSPRRSNNHATSPKKIQLRKKRILSDCFGELDNDQAARIKKGRSERPADLGQALHPTEGTASEAQTSMQVEEDEEVEEDELEEEEDEEEGTKDDELDNEANVEKKESDSERYMTTDNGQKKKLVQIRLDTPESNYSPEEGATEYRWVTRRQFQDLGQRGMLLMEDDQWEGDSITSIDSLDSNHLSTPKKRATSITLERGPIWSIEGKKSTSSSSTKICLPQDHQDISPQPLSRSRARNSLGRIRLSLPPPPPSPLQRSRSRLLSPLKPL